MDSISSPSTILRQLLDQIIQWIVHSDSWRTSQLKRLKRNISKSVYEVNIPCSESDLAIVYNHASFLCADHSGEFILLWKHSCLGLNNAWRNRFRTSNFGEVNKLVVYFLQHLKEVFKVPKLINHVDVYVSVSNFMDFLSELLIGKALEDIYPVIKELRCFITIFLDTPFQDSTEDRQVHNTLLSQFETLVNEAGRLVHSFVFSLHPSHERMDEVLSDPISHLKADIIEFLNSYMNTWNTPNCPMSSIFIVDSFLHDLENLMNQEDGPIVEVKDHVERLHRSLKLSWSLSNLNSHKTEDDVKKIVLLAYDAEYLINYFLCGDAPAWYLAVRLPGIIHHIELVGTRLDLEGEIKENHDIDLESRVADNFGSEQLTLQAGINSGGINDTIVGFEDEEHKILDKLVGGGEGLQMISIIGMGGLGKTTLAKKLYNHPTVAGEFDKFSWSIVSQMHERKNLLVQFLMGLELGVEKSTIEKMEDDRVGLRIYQFLKGRRYFIVIDDIWRFSAWEEIKRYFPDDRNGSRILFTSRNNEAVPCNSHTHALPLLSNDQCWELLKKKVFHGKSCPPQLQHIGEQIATKCNGLPLAVVVVAGILSTMGKDLNAWDNVRVTLDSYISSYHDDVVRKTLELSYIHLPHHLKPCFLYFGRFQEDEEIRVKTVTRFWIAEGFIPKHEKNSTDNTAEAYLKELIDRSLVIVAKTTSNSRAKVCIMHDLLRDMCLKIAEEDGFLKLVDGDSTISNLKSHRLVHCSSSFGSLQPYGPRARSFISYEHSSLSLNVCRMKVLRILDSQPVHLHLVGMENLVHLRYLAVREMPNRPTSPFSNLEFLIVGDYQFPTSLIILNLMKKLRYLRAWSVEVDTVTDCNTSQTYNLESLSKVEIYNQDDEQWLKHLPCLRKLKCEYHSSLTQHEPLTSDLSFLTRLESLTMSDIATIGGIKLPLNIIKLKLSTSRLSWEKMSMIGLLPNLEVLEYESFVRGSWETRDDEFQKLKYLKLYTPNLVEWNVSSWEHFPMLQQLISFHCRRLKEFPCEIGDIPTLQLIEVSSCCQSMAESLRQIQEQLKEYGNEDVKIVVEDILKDEDKDDNSDDYL